MSLRSVVRLLSATSLALLLAACLTNASLDASATISKSPRDTREYRALELDNGLKVLLVSDPTTDKAAAAIDVDAGSNVDPQNFPGLAHFLEHMLFLGTAKYPEAGEYQQYISSHGGSHNAYTAYDNTNYYFDIDQADLEPALDRFSQFFIAPLFTQAYVDRERNAVHSEYQSGLQDDGRRGYSALKAVLNRAHPLTRFSVGSLDTLQDRPEQSLRDALLQHYETFYSANEMSAAILGAQSLDELESMARHYFAAIPRRQPLAAAPQVPLFTPGSLPALLSIVPIRDSRALSFTFPIPDVREDYQAKPLNYLGNVLGHEGEGSLLALLRQRGWANGLSAGGGFGYRDASTFSVSISLTEAGIEHIDDISALLFEFIALIKQDGIQPWLFAEQRTMAELAFEYQDPSPPIGYVSALAQGLQEYPASQLLTAPYTYSEFNPKLLQDLLARMTPDNLLMTVTSRTVKGTMTDTWYGTQYRVQALSNARIARWNTGQIAAELAIAAPNPFIPEDLSIKPMQGTVQAPEVLSAEAKPQLLVDTDGVRLWFKQDQEFLIPRANFYVYAMTPVFNNSLRNSLLSSFVVSLVNDKLNEYSYPANLAGAYFGLSGRSRGFTLTVGGYNDKQEVLLDTLLATLVDSRFSAERFSIIKSEMIRSWQNASLQTPYVRLFQEAQALLVQPYWSEAEKIAAVQNIELDEVLAFVPQMLENLRIDALYHGNVQPEDAQRMLAILKKYLHPDSLAPIPGFGSVVKLPADTRVVQELQIAHDDSAIVIYLQGQDDSIHTRATISLLAAVLRTPFYDTLRTEKQLGYIVNVGTLPILKVNGLVLYIESPVADPLVLEASIDEFLLEYAGELATMTPTMFADIKSGLLTNMRQAPQRLDALTSRYWSDIMLQEYTRDSTLQMANEIEALTQEELVRYYQLYIADPQAGRLVARSAGREMLNDFLVKRVEANATVILDDGQADYAPFKAAAQQYEFGL